MVRRLLRRALVRGEHRQSSPTSRRTGPTCSSPSTRARSPSPATRPRPTRPPPASGRRASPRAARSTTPRRASTSSSSSTTPATSCRSSPRPPPSPRATRRSASRWTYNALADKDSLKGNPPIDVVVPTSGRFGGMYVQAISAYAPHPNAAKLWMEYLYSDEGQNAWLKGYCNPIRYDDMVSQGHRRPGGPGQAAGHERRAPADPGPDHARRPT